MTNPFVATGGDPNPRVLGDEVTAYLLSQPRLVAWVNGHTHRNEITAHTRADGSGGFWEINTASHIDYPQQSRLVEVADNADGTLSIFTTILDHAGSGGLPRRPGLDRQLWPASPASSPSTTRSAKLDATGRAEGPQHRAAGAQARRHALKVTSVLGDLVRKVSRLVCSSQRWSARTAGSFSSSPSMIRPPMISWPT